jgi:hypothetical protein
MTKQELLVQLSSMGILAQDLRLFLDVNPTNQEALAEFKLVTAEYRNLISLYERNFGPMTGGHDINGSWTANPWPWHRDMGGNA